MMTKNSLSPSTLGLALILCAWATPARADSARVSAVWAREETYWRDVKNGDAEHYETLWHEQFVGWPCGQDHPLRKASIGDWVRKVRDGHIAVAVNLTHEGAQEFGDIVVVHYSFTRVDTFPDGHVKGKGERRKITHTWMKVGDDWVIIGGMCGELAIKVAAK